MSLHLASGRRSWLAVCIALLTLHGAALAGTTAGSGQRATETRQVEAFEAIASSGAIRLVVRQAATQSVQVQADDNLLPLIETQVQERRGVPTLIVRIQPGERLRSHGEIVVAIDSPRLSALAAAGSGPVEVHGLKSPAFKLSLAGSGDAVLRSVDVGELGFSLAGSADLTANGRAEQVKLSIAGSADADLGELAASEVSVSIAGSGDAEVNASRSLKVSIAGSGDLRYRGEPAELKTTVVGSGRVQRR